VAQLKDVIERVHHVKVTLGVNETLQAEYTDERVTVELKWATRGDAWEPLKIHLRE
jgi:hypothetical protein